MTNSSHIFVDKSITINLHLFIELEDQVKVFYVEIQFYFPVSHW